MTPAEALSLGDREVISLVGGGGKTALMYALGRELSARGGVIVTTTTRIREPEPAPIRLQFLSEDLLQVGNWVAENADRKVALLVARRRLPGGKLEGIPPGWVDMLSRREEVSTIVVEADGSAGRPLKAPREGEPVIPQSSTLLVPVMGIDGMGRPLDEAWVFRSAIAARLLDLPPGSTVTEEAAARLMRALLKDAPPGSRVVPVINKIDLPGGREKALRLARYLLSMDPGIGKVILCRLRESSDVEVIASGLLPR
ncbi:MAG: putative selenium-dependent hydroxylase accessory protein YqeC [Deltaproteobacteria bacterium]|nr:putative selenium-dependent hydroxylase accessory protein YqeC [Deltaproteobacteria bacterium]